jgi:chemotaxis protein CheD
VVQGEFHVTADPDVVLTTILGSCVAACLRDPLAQVGGMNHFLLPGRGEDAGGDTVRYGAHAMELLVNGLLREGARRERLEAKLFGGARMLEGLTDIGTQNAEFAKYFLQQERIAFTGGSLRGDRGRRVQFWPASGRARQIIIEQGEAPVFAAERRAKAAPTDVGPVELL